MNLLQIALLAGGFVALLAAGTLQPVPQLGFLLQTLGVGGAIGLTVAYRARQGASISIPG